MIYNIHANHGGAQAAFIPYAADGYLNWNTVRKVRRVLRGADEDAHLVIVFDQVPNQNFAYKTGASSNQDHIKERL
jgi:hypothetical protein